LYTKFTVSVEVEADTREEAEEKVWELYNDEKIDPMDANDIETNLEYNGRVLHD
jgi:hypothetical protein